MWNKQQWQQSLWFGGALAVGAVLTWTTPTPTPFYLIGLLVVGYGAATLDRLPKPKRHSDFKWELPDDYVTFRIDSILEDEFKVQFIDDWEIGRGFSLFGSV